MSEPYSIHAEIRGVLDGTSLSDPGEIADKTLENIPASHVREVLRLTLRSYVREVMRAQRGTQFSGSSQNANDTQRSSAAAGSSSWKRDAIREGWRRHLNDRYSAAGEWLRLAEMTFEHLSMASSERAELAARTSAQAARLAGFAELVKAHKVSTFGDLPASVLAEVLS